MSANKTVREWLDNVLSPAPGERGHREEARPYFADAVVSAIKTAAPPPSAENANKSSDFASWLSVNALPSRDRWEPKR